MRWFVIYRDNSNKLPIYKQGKTRITSNLNPFKILYENSIEKRDNDNIYDELCKWAIGNLESLTITLIGNKINQLLQSIIK